MKRVIYSPLETSKYNFYESFSKIDRFRDYFTNCSHLWNSPTYKNYKFKTKTGACTENIWRDAFCSTAYPYNIKQENAKLQPRNSQIYLNLFLNCFIKCSRFWNILMYKKYKFKVRTCTDTFDAMLFALLQIHTIIIFFSGKRTVNGWTVTPTRFCTKKIWK